LAKALDGDPSHEAGERREATLFGMRRHARQLEDFVGHLWIQVRCGNRRASFPSGFSEPAAQGLEPGVHLEAHRITAPTLPSPKGGGFL